MAKSGMSDSESEGNGQSGQDVAQRLIQDLDQVQNDSAENAIANPIIQTSTPISIVIQSLVQNLCLNYEQDDIKAQATYKMICDMLYEMMIIDKSYLMKEFEGIRNQYQRAFHQLLASSPRGDGQTLRPIWSSDISNEWSHYKREFDELSYIAGGGFGKVFRVRHKLDDTEYAIKKIFIRSNSIESVRNYLTEVKTFASLNHSNIVQYKAAWLELGASTSPHTLDDQSSGDLEFEDETEISETREGVSETSIFADLNRDLDNDDNHQESSEFDICFEYSRHVSFTHTTRKTTARVKRNSTSEGGHAICKPEEIRRLQVKHHPKWATLFIQMSLCHSTLKQWLETRNMAEVSNKNALVPVNDTRRFNTVMEILRQLLIGLEYIHSKGIVHHDIKPSNIFMQLENKALLVQLGDFGLACPLQSTQHSLACGTKLYAAPEQLAGKCDPKSDMYSLGIVVFELTETFSTDMERITNITNLRKGHLPKTTAQQQPQLTQIISELVVRQIANRPDATTLLKVIDAKTAESNLVRDLQTKVAEQDIQLAVKDEEILRLKEQLSRLQSGTDNHT